MEAIESFWSSYEIREICLPQDFFLCHVVWVTFISIYSTREDASRSARIEIVYFTKLSHNRASSGSSHNETGFIDWIAHPEQSWDRSMPVRLIYGIDSSPDDRAFEFIPVYALQ